MQENVKHKALYESLKRQILDGRFDDAHPFPSEMSLVRENGLSRQTVRAAFQKLRLMGLIEGHRGEPPHVTKLGAMRKIGLVVPGIAYSEFYPVIVGELSRLAMLNKFTLVFCDALSNSPETRANQVVEFAAELIRQNVAGVLFHPIECVRNATRLNKRIVSAFDEAGVPVVLLDTDILPPPERSSYDVVGVNNYAAGQRLAIHLIAAGAKRIHCMMYDFVAGSVRNRFSGVQSCVRSVEGLKTGILCAEPDDVRKVRAYVNKFRPDAFVCGNDTVAAILGQTLRKIGRRIPDDILLAGFDDLRHAEIMTPQLTTIHQPCAALAKSAFETLLARMRHPKSPPREIFLSAPLVVRESTRKIPMKRRMAR